MKAELALFIVAGSLGLGGCGGGGDHEMPLIAGAAAVSTTAGTGAANQAGSGGASASGASGTGGAGAGARGANTGSAGTTDRDAGAAAASGSAAGRAGSGDDAASGSDGGAGKAGAAASGNNTTGGAGGSADTAGASAGSGGTSATGTSTGGALMLSSSAVMSGAKLPSKYRCVMLNGMSGPSPALSWSGGPSAMSYAVTLTDLTNKIAHWTLYDIPATITSLPEGVPLGAMPAMPAGAKQTANQFAAMTGPGYFGPCPGASSAMYELEVYALDVAMLSGVSESSSAADVRTQISAHALAMGTAKLGFTSSSADP